MKVAHLTSVHPPLDIRIFQKECRTLAEAGYSVVLVAPGAEDRVVDGVTLKGVSRPEGRLARMLLTTWRVMRAGLAERAGLYHLHDPELLPVGRILRWLGKQVVFDMHENVPKALLTKTWIPDRLRNPAARLYRVLEVWLIGDMPVVFAEQSYRKDYPWVRRCETVQNMPRVAALRSIAEAPHAVPTLGYIGSVTPERGSLVTLEAIRLLKHEGLTVHWDCAGAIEKGHRAELEAFVARHGLEGVTFHGMLPVREGWRLMARCQIGLSVLAPIPNYYESYPTKLFEYMALGLPVIASAFPLYREVVEGRECGLCISPEDPEALSLAIKQLLADRPRAEAMGRRGREAVASRFNWETEKNKLLRLYEDLSQPPSAGREALRRRAG